MGDSSMQSLLPSIMHFDHDNLPSFVKPLEEKYLCVSCNHLLKPPIRQTPCGHRICEQCILMNLFAEHEEIDCPGNEEDCVKLRKDEVKKLFLFNVGLNIYVVIYKLYLS